MGVNSPFPLLGMLLLEVVNKRLSGRGVCKFLNFREVAHKIVDLLKSKQANIYQEKK